MKDINTTLGSVLIGVIVGLLLIRFVPSQHLPTVTVFFLGVALWTAWVSWRARR